MKKKQKHKKSHRSTPSGKDEYITESMLHRKAMELAKNAYSTECEYCLQTYNQALVEKKLGYKRRELKQMNLIDIRNIDGLEYKNDTSMPSIDITKDVQLWGEETGWFIIIPCFSEGALQVNKDRYIYYKVEDLNAENKSMVITLQDYIGFESHWEVGVQGKLLVECTTNYETGSFITSIGPADEDSCYLYSDIYSLINPESLGWNKRQIDCWYNIVIEHSKSVEEALAERDTNAVQELCTFFMRYIIAINYVLAKNKPSRPIKQKTSEHKTEKQIVTNSTSSEKPLRIVGSLKIRSENPPKRQTEATIIKYKTASWRRRATIRKLKNGKMVHVKESVCYRKCLKNESQTPNVTIKFRKDAKWT